MPGGTISTCSGNFYDSGGDAANYSNNENLTTTFCSADPGKYLKVKFNSINLSNFDVLTIYDGANASAPSMGTFTNVTCIDEFISSTAGGCLTFKFSSNSSTNAFGWDASISCVSAPQTYVNMRNGTVNTCGGSFYDSGGPNCSYLDNENYTLTVCPDQPNKYLKLSFDSVDLPNFDVLKVYDGPTTSSPQLGSFTSATCLGDIIASSSGGCLTFNFISNSSTRGFGWAGTLSCVSAPPTYIKMHTDSILTCGGQFYDSGGPNCTYLDNENYTLTLCPDQPNKYLKLSFDSLDLSIYDILKVYDGPTTSSPVLGVFSNATCLADIIASSNGGCLTFNFTSNSSTREFGWAATLSCVSTPPTAIKMHTDSILTCGGQFYDSGGPNCTYLDNENYTLTICPDQPNKYLKLSFDTLNLPIYDILKVYDGPTTSSPALGVFSNATCLADIIASSNGGCLTFNFTSNSSTREFGWAGTLSCLNAPSSVINMRNDSLIVCSGQFYDSGGESCTYLNNEIEVLTMCPPCEGDSIQVVFSEFSTSQQFDNLRIYNGANISAIEIAGSPFFGTTSPGIVKASNATGCLTFKFTSNSSSTSNGWSSTISCTSGQGELPVASFTVQSPVEISQASLISFTGTAGSGAIFNWDFDGGAAVPGGNSAGPHQVTWSTAGSKTIRLRVTNGCYSDSTTVPLIVKEPAGIYSSSSNNGTLRLYPNPLKPGEELTIEFADKTIKTAHIEVLDLLGKQIQVEKIHDMLLKFKVKSELPAGIYVLKINTGNQSITQLISVVSK
jgi:hypothetical protein